MRHPIPRSRFFRTLILTAALLGAGVSAWAYQPADLGLFGKANEAYREGRFGEAAEAYTQLSERYPGTAAFFYNLGNSYFRSGSLGAAILAYERALLLKPRDRDTRRNLSYVKGLLEYRVEDKRNWYLRAGEAVLKRFTEEEVHFLTLFTFFLFLSSWAFVLFFRPGMPWGWWRKTSLTVAAVFFLLFVSKSVEMHVIRDAIVMSKEAEVRYGPSQSDQVAFRLGEGLKVYVIDRRENWSRIVLSNGETGWVQNRQIAEVYQ